MTTSEVSLTFRLDVAIQVVWLRRRRGRVHPVKVVAVVLLRLRPLDEQILWQNLHKYFADPGRHLQTRWSNVIK